MEKELTEEDYKIIAAQLRKPEGEDGISIGELMNGANRPINLHTLAVLDPKANESILEIGMGNGHFVKNIVKLNSSIKYTGCDYSELMVEQAAQTNRKFVKKGRASFVQGNIQELPFLDNSFDKIFTVNTFYFWDEFEKSIAELRRVIKNDGILILSGRPKHNMETSPVTRHGFSIYSNEEIIELMQSNGFNLKDMTNVMEPSQEHFGKSIAMESSIMTFKL